MKAEWDKTNSTFRSEMMPTEWVGYSKKIGHPERKDPITLLTNWVLRLYRDGYLRKSSKPFISEISFYFNKSSEHIITFYKNYPEWNSKFLFDENYVRLNEFVKRFYSMIDKNVSPDLIYQKLYVKNKSKSNPFNLNHPRFSSKNDLERFCGDIASRGTYPKEEVREFYIKYLDKFFPSSSSNTALIRSLDQRFKVN